MGFFLLKPWLLEYVIRVQCSYPVPSVRFNIFYFQLYGSIIPIGIFIKRITDVKRFTVFYGVVAIGKIEGYP